MRGEVVDRLVHRLAPHEARDVLHEERRVDRIGMVEVDELPFLECQVAQVEVIRVLVEEGGAGSGGLLDRADDGRLPRARSSHDADDQGRAAAQSVTAA